jgi:hypothetical protein
MDESDWTINIDRDSLTQQGTDENLIPRSPEFVQSVNKGRQTVANRGKNGLIFEFRIAMDDVVSHPDDAVDIVFAKRMNKRRRKMVRELADLKQIKKDRPSFHVRRGKLL